jgi:protein arginine N-methyltransferase 1
MYSIADYGDMIADQVRMNGYIEALKRSVKPGAIVIDLGAGIGVFAMLACRFGARKVYAIEPNDAIHVARQIADANGYSDRIEFIQELSTKVTLPEKADVIVSDLRGVLPLFDKHLITLADARKRLLARDGVLIPQQDTLWATVVSANETYHSYVAPWEEHNRDLDLRAARHITINTWGKGQVAAESFLTEPKIWAQLDYTSEENTDFSAELNWDALKGGNAYGLHLWFDTLLCEGVGFSNYPGKSAKVYGSAFFPWTSPVQLTAGDKIKVELKANLIAGSYIWSWKTLVIDGAQPGREKASFNQSTFFSTAYSPAQLRKQADNFIPSMNEDGVLDQFILGLINGERNQREIAQKAMEQFPKRFARWQDALTHVAKLSNKYSL